MNRKGVKQHLILISYRRRIAVPASVRHSDVASTLILTLILTRSWLLYIHWVFTGVQIDIKVAFT